jgi:hypothetical protein
MNFRSAGFRGQIGVHIRQDRILVEVVFDDARDVGVDDLVVGHPGADGVGHGDVAGAVGADQTRHAQDRIGPEDGRIEEVVVDAPVDHVHRHQAGGRAHEDPGVAHHQIAALDDGNAHLAGEEGVLEIGAVGTPGVSRTTLGLSLAPGAM